MGIRRMAGAACALLAAAVLAGCAHPDLIDISTPETAVTASLGEPDAKIALPEGGSRLVYSLQPMAQEVWWITLDRTGRVTAKENVLNREHFTLIQPGVSTEQDVWNLFGRCAQTYTFALKNEHAWMYRFLDEGMFHMACWVQFNTAGVVTEVGYTTDPWHDRDGDWF